MTFLFSFYYLRIVLYYSINYFQFYYSFPYSLRQRSHQHRFSFSTLHQIMPSIVHRSSSHRGWTHFPLNTKQEATYSYNFKSTETISVDMNLNHVLHLLAVSSCLAFTSVNHATLHAYRNPSFPLKMSGEVTEKTTEDDSKVCLITGSSRGMYLVC